MYMGKCVANCVSLRGGADFAKIIQIFCEFLKSGCIEFFGVILLSLLEETIWNLEKTAY